MRSNARDSDMKMRTKVVVKFATNQHSPRIRTEDFELVEDQDYDSNSFESASSSKM